MLLQTGKILVLQRIMFSRLQNNLRTYFPKKLSFVFVILILLTTSCQEMDSELAISNDYEVSVELATQVAKNYAQSEAFLNQPAVTNKASRTETRQISQVIPIRGDDNLVAMYIVQFQPQGFVIVAGTRKEYPILAFSETGNFNYSSTESEKLAGVDDWIQARKAHIKWLRRYQRKASKDVEEQWDASAPPHDDEIIVSGGTEIEEQGGPLLSTKWGQEEGYNDALDPICFGGTRPPTGCVATATAQVMKYWQHPTSYNWSAMPNSGGSTEISQLMKNIGTEVGMVYDCGGSGTSTINAMIALVNAFGYSSSASYVNFSQNTVINQIDLAQPVIMRGAPSAGLGGHAWVCDGYKQNRYAQIHNPGTIYEYKTYTLSPHYFHMNWGWDGHNDTWYLPNVLTPGGSNYSHSRKIIIDIHP